MLENLFVRGVMQAWPQMALEWSQQIIKTSMNWVQCPMSSDLLLTRVHSSGMCTACLLTVSQHALCRGCVSQHALGRGVCQRCTCQGGVPAQGGFTCPGGRCTCPAGCTCLGDVPAQGAVSQHAMGRHPRPLDRQRPVKT